MEYTVPPGKSDTQDVSTPLGCASNPKIHISLSFPDEPTAPYGAFFIGKRPAVFDEMIISSGHFLRKTELTQTFKAAVGSECFRFLQLRRDKIAIR